jgi:transcriptional regulator with XRE-family HTH domain
MAMNVVDADSAAAELRRQLLRAVSQEVQSWKVAQGEAARRLGTDRVALNRLLQGKRTPSLQALLEFANAADMTFRFTLEDTTGTLVSLCGTPRPASHDSGKP